MADNILGEPLQVCCTAPTTGFYRDGFCNTGPDDVGAHVVCARVTAAFLEYTQAKGNDLSTPQPLFGFPGLKPGDCWCLCAARWREARDAGVAPPVNLAATHEAVARYVSLAELEEYALPPSDV